MATVPLTEAELIARRSVWEALSELFLDTHIAVANRAQVSILCKSPYSIEELRSILLEEVYPVCKYNLASVTGVWSGFDMAWLEREIVKRRQSPLWRLNRFLNRPPAWLFADWDEIEAAVKTFRTSAR